MPKTIPRGAHLHGLKEAAAVVGMTPQGFIKAGTPEPDVWINDTRGWTTETLHEWQRTRPRGRRTLTDELRARASSRCTRKAAASRRPPQPVR
ncbi:hypothetical protein [Kocuria marina]|uniref:hypothetical protein n=1 Tax=Kocuria marina TaxID=223184 RepID=UPI001F15337A|nr:hypothetical protein [Kocuria indica]